MLHCNMNTLPANPWVLEDLLADLVHARRNQDLGRLALLAYCEVKSWARQTDLDSNASFAAIAPSPGTKSDGSQF